MNIHLQGKVNKVVVDYYRLLDERAPLEELQNFFFKDGFEINKGDLVISSFDEYANWYDQNKINFFDCQHLVERLDAIQLDEKRCQAVIWMNYKAKTKNYEKIVIHGIIKWNMIDTPEGLKITDYFIEI